MFISYSRRDEDAAVNLKSDLERAGLPAWVDLGVQGGQEWWEAILRQVRECLLFVFVVSEHSFRSHWCRTELGYAIALRRPILPVTVRDVDYNLAPDAIGKIESVDYRLRTPESAIVLTTAALRLCADAQPLPDPLPPAPAFPTVSLEPIGDRVTQPVLTPAEQVETLVALRSHLDDGDVHDAALELLTRLRARTDVTNAVATEIDEMRASMPSARREAEGSDGIRSLITHIEKGRFLPITGFGLTDSLPGPRDVLARKWADASNFSMARKHRDDLPRVAQFVGVMNDAENLRSDLADHLLESAPAESTPGDRLHAAWLAHRATGATDPHMVLASLPCRIYVNAHPARLLVSALREVGKDPQVELCRWRPDVGDWPPSVFNVDPSYEPSPDRPLVFQVFGNLDFRESIVLTEDDYLDFLVNTAEDKTLVPPCVRRALADSALLFLGFGLEDWDMKVLLRALVNQEGARKLKRYAHIAAQVELRSTVLSWSRAQRYLLRYFSKYEPPIDVYWGTVDQFASDLAAQWGART